MRSWFVALITFLGTLLLLVITSSNISAQPSDPNTAMPILKDQNHKLFAQRQEIERPRREPRVIRRRAEVVDDLATPSPQEQSDKWFAEQEAEDARRRQEQLEIGHRAEEERKRVDELSRIEREKFLRSQQTQELFSVFKASCKRATKGGRDPYGRTFTAEFQEKMCDCVFIKLTGSNDLVLVRDFIKLEGGNQLTTDSHPMATFAIEQSIGICVLEPTVPGLR